MKRIGYAAMFAVLLAQISGGVQDAQRQTPITSALSIPKTWDDQEMATLEIPLATPVGSPRQAPSSYYYSIPVRPIYKNYPVYAPGREPQGYIDSLKQREPEIIWDDHSHRPPL